MHVIVCIKQVPDSQKVKVDPKTGVLLRSSADTKMNPYDLYALETAIRIKEQTGCRLTALSMGPLSAKEVIAEAMAMGVDDGYLLSDRRFGGADVKATGYTLAQGIKHIDEDYDLIICGRQTTDGDTAQVGPSVSEYLGIPHVSWCRQIAEISEKEITVKQNLNEYLLTVAMEYPCLITVEKGIYQPRLPSYRLQKASEKKEIRIITLDDLPDNDPDHYGASGSATQVEGIFEPNSELISEVYDGDGLSSARQLYDKLVSEKFVEVR